MELTNIIVLAVILLILGLASFFVYRSKKQGKACIGCACSGDCSNCKK